MASEFLVVLVLRLDRMAVIVIKVIVVKMVNMPMVLFIRSLPEIVLRLLEVPPGYRLVPRMHIEVG